MQLSDNTIVALSIFFLAQTGSLLWFLSSINSKARVISDDLSDLSKHVAEQNGRISKAELRCARIHGLLSDDERGRD